MLRPPKLLPVLVLLPVAFACAEVWRHYDEQGNPVYSDEPRPGAERLELPELQTVPAVKPAPAPARVPEAPGAFAGYTLIDVLTPEPDATFRDGTGDVTVSVALTPNLQVGRGHRLVVLLDGAPQGEPGEASTITLRNLDRGTHSVAARVVDDRGRPIGASDAVTFHVFRNVARPRPPG